MHDPSRRYSPSMTRRSHRLLAFLFLMLGLALAGFWKHAAESQGTTAEQGLTPIRSYISSSWDTLTRSMAKCDTLADPKLTAASVLYLPAGYPVPPAVQELQKRCHVHVQQLPVLLTGPGEIDFRKIDPPGLLYLENDYVVPGGRFNEMWTREPHLAGSTGLSRYYDFGEGPVPEGLQDESGFYRGVAAYFLSHPDSADHDLLEIKSGEKSPDATGFTFRLQLCQTVQDSPTPKCDQLKTLSLSRDYYKGDRAMRESGFDVSFRFRPSAAATPHYAPVCLNSLLYKTEKDLEQMSEMLGRGGDAKKWRQRAEDRREKIQKFMWDNQRGLFFDYNLETQARSTYEYLTTFYPLWVGLATPEQARAIVHNLAIFERPGGLSMSHRETGGQWDYPYAWAPTQLLAVEGLRRYGYDDEANRVSYKFLSMVAENFRHDGNIHEKYNAVTRSSETQVTAGYKSNVVGFGWTNAVFLEFLHALPQGWVERLARAQTAAVK